MVQNGLKMSIYQLKEIETPRLIIRPVRLGDENEINQAINRSLETLQRWMPWSKDPSLETTLEFCKKADTECVLKRLSRH